MAAHLLSFWNARSASEDSSTDWPSINHVTRVESANWLPVATVQRITRLEPGRGQRASDSIIHTHTHTHTHTLSHTHTHYHTHTHTHTHTDTHTHTCPSNTACHSNTELPVTC